MVFETATVLVENFSFSNSINRATHNQFFHKLYMSIVYLLYIQYTNGDFISTIYNFLSSVKLIFMGILVLYSREKYILGKYFFIKSFSILHSVPLAQLQNYGERFHNQVNPVVKYQLFYKVHRYVKLLTPLRIHFCSSPLGV